VGSLASEHHAMFVKVCKGMEKLDEQTPFRHWILVRLSELFHRYDDLGDQAVVFSKGSFMDEVVEDLQDSAVALAFALFFAGA
jgi:hypothetical protein